MDKYVKYVLASIPISGGILYLAGVFFNASYFEFWGLDSGLFPFSVNDTVVRGVLAFFLFFGTKYSYSIVVGSLALFLLFIGLNWGIDSLGFKRKADPQDKNGNIIQKPRENLFSEFSGGIGLGFGILTFIGSVLFLLTVCIAILADSMTSVGKESARQQYNELTSVKWDEDSIHDVLIVGKGFNKTKRRRMVTCSTTDCVFLTKDGVETINRSLIVNMKTFTKSKVFGSNDNRMK